MENHKRALRRWKKHVKFLRRLHIWIKPGMTNYFDRDEFGTRIKKFRPDIFKEALEGKCYTFLRTTSRPCNCWDCTHYEKYVRPVRSEIYKQIWNDIDWEALQNTDQN